MPSSLTKTAVLIVAIGGALIGGLWALSVLAGVGCPAVGLDFCPLPGLLGEPGE
ncbi:MAG: hypothetical protein HYV62_03495 [Candidatus Rokubacteria bacterium]|nr:hypothetical protein [Candidatus Rokubacteria bacterium]